MFSPALLSILCVPVLCFSSCSASRSVCPWVVAAAAAAAAAVWINRYWWSHTSFLRATCHSNMGQGISNVLSELGMECARRVPLFRVLGMWAPCSSQGLAFAQCSPVLNTACTARNHTDMYVPTTLAQHPHLLKYASAGFSFLLFVFGANNCASHLPSFHVVPQRRTQIITKHSSSLRGTILRASVFMVL